MQQGYLILSSGEVFKGRLFGSTTAMTAGELVFNTSMSGYPEILTDPSYNGQIVLFTYPLIGNYGWDGTWSESGGIKASAAVVKRLYRGPLPPGRMSLDEVLCQAGVAGIEGVDTRALTLSIRDKGARNAVICPEDRLDEASSFLASFPDITQRDLIASVAVTERVRDPELPEGFAKVPASARHHIALVDFGIKTSIISCFYERGVAVDLLPPDFKAEDVLDKGYGMLFLSNGPGDPARLTDQVAQVARCITKIPVCGICLGHQLITWALGGRTVKMVYGHHGGNQPVKDLDTGKSFVSAQNHNYMSDMDSLPKGVRLWFTNANDGTVEGIYDEERRVRSVQFHPEACPGPHDGRWIFDAFIKEMER